MSELAQRQDFHGVTDTATQSERLGRAINGTTALTSLDRTVLVTANTASGAVVITLANVSEVPGAIVSIHTILANAQTVTITDAGDDATFVDIAPASGSRTVLYCDGLCWVKIN